MTAWGQVKKALEMKMLWAVKFNATGEMHRYTNEQMADKFNVHEVMEGMAYDVMAYTVVADMVMAYQFNAHKVTEGMEVTHKRTFLVGKVVTSFSVHRATVTSGEKEASASGETQLDVL